MNSDDDLEALLPEPPPPAPKPRKNAIAVALARFDGSTASVQQRAKRAPWWKSLHVPQAGLIAATALFVVITVPLTWRTPVPPVPTDAETVSSGTNNAEVSPAAKARGPLQSANSPAVKVGSLDDGPPSAQTENATMIPPPMEIAQSAPSAAPAPFALRENESAPSAAKGRVFSELKQDAPVAVAVNASEEHSGDESSIIVTGALRSSTKALSRGDWNACTVNDPERTLALCRSLAVKAPKALRSQAQAYFSDGLIQSWTGQFEKAVSAFDAVIEIAPNFAEGYLNRGLVNEILGNRDAAIADLNRAVRLSPRSARAFYSRSMLMRKYGNAKRADADAQQAINLDPRYKEILR